MKRASLLVQLEAIEQGGAFRKERTRRRRLVEDFKESEAALRARSVRLEELAGVQLQIGELRIEFHGAAAADLLRQLPELAMAIQSNYERFAEMSEGRVSDGS